MNKYIEKNKHALIVIAPLLLGWLFNILIFYVPFSGMLIWTLNLGFVLLLVLGRKAVCEAVYEKGVQLYPW